MAKELYLDILEKEKDKKMEQYNKIILRPYQEKALEDIEALLAFDNLAVCMLVTGAGKSIIIAKICETNQKHYDKIVVTTAISSLINQLDSIIFKLTGQKPNIIASGKDFSNPKSNIYLCMEQTLYVRDRSFLGNNLFINDEWHFSFGKRFKKVRENINPIAEIGFSATPIDEKGFLLCSKANLVQGPSVTEMIKMGYWDKPIYYLAQHFVDLDISEAEYGRDYSVEKLGDIYIENLSATLRAMEKLNYKSKQTVIFATSILHCEKLYDVLKEENIKVAMVHSKLKKGDNEQYIEDFKSGKINCIISVASLMIGFDAPNIQLLVNMRATKIYRTYFQLLSRATRPTPNGNGTVEILDLGNTILEHGPLEQPMQLISKYEKQDKKNKIEASLINEFSDKNIEDGFTYDDVNVAIKRYEVALKDYSNMPMKRLKAIYDSSYDIKIIFEIGNTIMERLNQPSVTEYTLNKTILKKYTDYFKKYEANKDIITRSVKRRIKKIIKENIDGNNKKMYGLFYYIDWLRENVTAIKINESMIDNNMQIDDEDLPF